ncbi:MAG TPA: SIMPL domain-containing protein [Rhizomicrobium sp.]|nr:SIMPL domain-containing protein [Rhizomicrobium sp.]
MIQTHKSLGTAALAGALAIACAAHADPAPPHILSVSGQGEVRAVPDQAQLSAGVVTEGKTAAAALAANSRAMNDVFAAIRKLGVPERSIRTSNFTVSPQYAPYRNNGADESAQRIIDYQVSNEMTVILDDVSKVGPALDALVSSGANQANSISFGIRDQKPLLEQARANAVKDATARAQTLAKAAGVTLGSILSIQEYGGYAQPVMMRTMALAAPAAPPPIAAGEDSITASVSMSWEIK